MQKSFLLVALFLLLPLSAIAQIEDGFFPAFSERDQAMFKIMLNPMLRTMFEEGDRSGVFIVMLSEMPIFPGFREEFGITPEQRRQFNSAANDPKTMPQNFAATSDALREKIENGIKEDLNYVPTEDEIATIESIYRYGIERTNEAAAETFTDEQMQRLNNMVFGLTGGLQSPFLSEKHMDALEMTAEQRAKFKKINEDTKPEREKMIAAFDAELQRMIKTGKMSVKDFFAALSTFRELGTTLRKSRTEVLTRAQLAKATEMAKLPKSMTFSLTNLLPQWMPGADSWKPGDPLPAGAVPQQPPPNRSGLFPRGEN
jgi:Spy/CpxP family protein refolding chaperone